MIEFYSDLGQIDPEHICQGELKSEVMFKEDKKYHIDLKVKILILSLLLFLIVAIYQRNPVVLVNEWPRDER